MHRFPTERARLKVRNPAGDVQVETGDVAETTVELVPLNDSEATRQAIEKASVTARGDEVIVELEGGRGWSISIGSWGIGSAKVSVRITCPNGSDLECDTASADVRVTGTLGDARIRTASGDLQLDRVEGSLEAKSASGDVQVEHVERPRDMNTVSGDVDLRTAMNGLARQLRSPATSSSARCYGDLDVGTVSGDLIVRAAGPGEVGGEGGLRRRRRRDAPRPPRQARRQLGQRLRRLRARRQRHALARRRAGGEPPRPHRQRRRPDHARRGGGRVAMRRPGGLWRHRDFLSLWGAETISQFGTQVSLLALPLVAILVLEESAFKVAALTSVEFLPFLLFTLPAASGSTASRGGRSSCSATSAARSRSCPCRSRTGSAALTIWQLYASASPSASAPSSSTSPTSRTCRARRRGDVVEGNAKLEISRAAANIGGPGVAGGSCRLLTAPVAVLVDAVSYLVSALLLSRIRKQEEAPRPAERRSPSPSSSRASATSSGTPTSARWSR